MAMLKLGTRGSQLAMYQANTTASLLKTHAGVDCEIVVIKTSGDRLAEAPLSEIGGAAYSWSQHVIGSALEGDNIVWGAALLEGDNIVWGTNIVWGSNIVWSNRVIGQRTASGSNIVWGSAIAWDALESDNIVWGTMLEGDNIVWGTALREVDNIVWGTYSPPHGEA